MYDLTTVSDLLCKKLNILLSHPEYIADMQYIDHKVGIYFEFEAAPRCRIAFEATLISEYAAELTLRYSDIPSNKNLKFVYSTKVSKSVFNRMKDTCKEYKIQRDLNKILNLTYNL